MPAEARQQVGVGEQQVMPRPRRVVELRVRPAGDGPRSVSCHAPTLGVSRTVEKRHGQICGPGQTMLMIPTFSVRDDSASGDPRVGVRPKLTTVLELETPQGLARAHVKAAEDPRAALVLGHGAGGSVSAPDLVAAGGVALDEGVTVALVEQPYRVAGRRSPPPAPRLDAAWLEIVPQLPLDGLPLITGGRSSGARVACRTAAQTGAIGVLCLPVPLIPPGNPPSRQPELDAGTVPLLVVPGGSG